LSENESFSVQPSRRQKKAGLIEKETDEVSNEKMNIERLIHHRRTVSSESTLRHPIIIFIDTCF
jgi:hypothetical protein